MTATPTRLYKGTPPAPATPSIRSASGGTTGTFGATTYTYTLPSYAVGDTVVIVYGSTSTMTLTTTGWTRAWPGATGVATSSGYEGIAGTIYKTMTDTTATSITFSVGNGAAYSISNTVFANADTPVQFGGTYSPASPYTLPAVTEYFFNGGIYVSTFYGSTGSIPSYSNTSPYTLTTQFQQSSGMRINLTTAPYPATTTVGMAPYLGSPGTVNTPTNQVWVSLFMSNTGAINAPAGSTLYTATSKTIITSISAGAGLYSRGGTSGKLRLQIAGTEYMRDLDVGNGRYQLVNPTHVIESGETIVGMSDSGLIPVIISGVVIT